jgi:hypothetical protein
MAGQVASKISKIQSETLYLKVDKYDPIASADKSSHCIVEE